MAVTLTVPQLAYALRLQADTTTDVEEPINGVLAGLLSAATELVIAYAPTAPDAVHNEATTRVAGYLYDVPPGANRRDMNPMRDSGAMPLLARYHVQRATSLAEDGQPTIAPPPDVPTIGGLNAEQVRQLIQQELAGLVTSTALAQSLANYATLAALTGHAVLPNVHHTPPEAGETGINIDQARDLIKAFARTGSTVLPLPADLAPNAVAGRVLGMRTAGGQLETDWVEILFGSPHLIFNRLPTADEIAVGGVVASGGLVFVERPNLPLVIYNRFNSSTELTLVATAAQPFVEPGIDGMLPAAADFPNRIALAGNQLLWSRGEQGAGKMVGFADYGPTRPEPPARTAQELLFAGSFGQPPPGHYVVNALAWDYGSEVWLQNQTNNDDDWASYSGPLGYHHGNLYLSDEDAAVHIPNATYIGRVYVIGHGSGQRPRVVTSYVAPTAPTAEWIPLGVQISDVTAIVNAHNMAVNPHTARLTAIEESSAAGDATLLAGYQAADADLQTAIDALTAASGLTILPYSATATYTFGGANSFVTHGNGVFFYRSTVSRSSNHDPGLFPGYWLDLTEGVTYQIIVDGAQRVSARTICVFNDTDEVFLCTTTQTTPRDKAYIRAQAGSIGGAFIQLGYATIPRDKLPPVREWTLNEDYRKGEIVDTTGANHRHFIALVDNNSSNISNRKQPGTPDGVGTWDQLFTVDNPPQAGPAGPPVQVVNGGTFDSSPENVTVASWRTYRWLQFVVFTGAGNAVMRWVSAPLASVILIADDDIDVPLQQNDALTLSKGAGDVLSIEAKGFSVTTGNTIDVWGFA